MASNSVSNVVIGSDTFQGWINKTNQLTELMRQEVVTVYSNSVGASVTGNGTVNGTFSATALAADTALRGGNVTTSNVLVVTSNVTIISNTLHLGTNGTVNGTILSMNATVTTVNTANLSANLNNLVVTVNTDAAINVENDAVLRIGNSYNILTGEANIIFDSSLVNTTSDSVISNGHGLSTGAALLYDPNGSTTHVGGLDSFQTYYARVTNSNTFTLYATVQGATDANASQLIDLTSVGTGNQKFYTQFATSHKHSGDMLFSATSNLFLRADRYILSVNNYEVNLTGNNKETSSNWERVVYGDKLETDFGNSTLIVGANATSPGNYTVQSKGTMNLVSNGAFKLLVTGEIEGGGDYNIVVSNGNYNITVSKNHTQNVVGSHISNYGGNSDITVGNNYNLTIGNTTYGGDYTVTAYDDFAQDIYGDKSQVLRGNYNSEIRGYANLQANGGYTILVGNSSVKNNYALTSKDFSQTITGNKSQNISGNVQSNTTGSVNIEVGNTYNINVGTSHSVRVGNVFTQNITSNKNQIVGGNLVSNVMGTANIVVAGSGSGQYNIIVGNTTVKNNYSITVKDFTQNIGGDKNQTVNGNMTSVTTGYANLTANGGFTLLVGNTTVKNNYSLSSKDFTQTISGNKNQIVSGNLVSNVVQTANIFVGSDYNIKVMGNHTVNVASGYTQDIYGQKNQYVSGNLTSTVAGTANLNANGGMNILVGNTTVKRNYAITAAGFTQTISGNKNQTVSGFMVSNVTLNANIGVGTDYNVNVGNTHAMVIGNNYNLTIGGAKVQNIAGAFQSTVNGQVNFTANVYTLLSGNTTARRNITFTGANFNTTAGLPSLDQAANVTTLTYGDVNITANQAYENVLGVPAQTKGRVFVTAANNVEITAGNTSLAANVRITASRSLLVNTAGAEGVAIIAPNTSVTMTGSNGGILQVNGQVTNSTGGLTGGQAYGLRFGGGNSTIANGSLVINSGPAILTHNGASNTTLTTGAWTLTTSAGDQNFITGTTGTPSGNTLISANAVTVSANAGVTIKVGNSTVHSNLFVNSSALVMAGVGTSISQFDVGGGTANSSFNRLNLSTINAAAFAINSASISAVATTGNLTLNSTTTSLLSTPAINISTTGALTVNATQIVSNVAVINAVSANVTVSRVNAPQLTNRNIAGVSQGMTIDAFGNTLTINSGNTVVNVVGTASLTTTGVLTVNTQASAINVYAANIYQHLNTATSFWELDIGATLTGTSRNYSTLTANLTTVDSGVVVGEAGAQNPTYQVRQNMVGNSTVGIYTVNASSNATFATPLISTNATSINASAATVRVNAVQVSNIATVNTIGGTTNPLELRITSGNANTTVTGNNITVAGSGTGNVAFVGAAEFKTSGAGANITIAAANAMVVNAATGGLTVNTGAITASGGNTKIYSHQFVVDALATVQNYTTATVNASSSIALNTPTISSNASAINITTATSVNAIGAAIRAANISLSAITGANSLAGAANVSITGTPQVKIFAGNSTVNSTATFAQDTSLVTTGNAAITVTTSADKDFEVVVGNTTINTTLIANASRVSITTNAVALAYNLGQATILGNSNLTVNTGFGNTALLTNNFTVNTAATTGTFNIDANNVNIPRAAVISAAAAPSVDFRAATVNTNIIETTTLKAKTTLNISGGAININTGTTSANLDLTGASINVVSTNTTSGMAIRSAGALQVNAVTLTQNTGSFHHVINGTANVEVTGVYTVNSSANIVFDTAGANPTVDFSETRNVLAKWANLVANNIVFENDGIIRATGNVNITASGGTVDNIIVAADDNAIVYGTVGTFLGNTSSNTTISAGANLNFSVPTGLARFTGNDFIFDSGVDVRFNAANSVTLDGVTLIANITANSTFNVGSGQSGDVRFNANNGQIRFTGNDIFFDSQTVQFTANVTQFSFPNTELAVQSLTVSSGLINGLGNVQYFTTNSIFTVPSTVGRIRVKVIGGGGGGGGICTSNNLPAALTQAASRPMAGSGGGGAGYSEKIIDVNALRVANGSGLGSPYDLSIVVGQGGLGGLPIAIIPPATSANRDWSNGSSGGTSKIVDTGNAFTDLIVAAGGQGGVGQLGQQTVSATTIQVYGGAGGSGANADFTVAGESGEAAPSIAGESIIRWSPVGAGGHSHLGRGGRQTFRDGNTVFTAAGYFSNGNMGSGYGAGGSGAYGVSINTSAGVRAAGANGTAGIVIIEW